MLGLLKTPAGKLGSAQRSANMDSQPSMSEHMSMNRDSNNLDSDVIARAAAANAAALRRNSSNYQATLSPPLASPSSVKTSQSSNEKNSIRMPKGMSFRNSSMTIKRLASGFRGSSQFESGDIVKEQYLSVRHRCQRELGAGVGNNVLDTSYSELLDWIEDERLTRLPHRGGCWDRVLISAQHFAGQVNRLAQAIELFAPDSCNASNMVFGQCLLLLERLGHENAAALDTAFTLFYKIGLEITPLLRREDILMASPQIMENVSRAFSDMLTIVADVVIAYYGAIHNLHHSQQASTKLDIYARFGHHMESFRARVRLCAYEIWRNVLERFMEDPDQVLVLQAWLAPQDTVLAMLSSDHVNLVSRAEEYTCTWLQPHLNSLFKGGDKCLIVQGKAGSGKTTLANWVGDRLQRPVSRKNISTLSFFFSSSVAALETPLAMLKTLLLQLLTQRIGDLDVFQTIMGAYVDSQTLSSHKQEERMWRALETALHGAYNDEIESLAIVIDLDELEAQKSQGKQVAERLQKLVQGANGVRLLLFTSPLEFKPATATVTVNMTIENIADDLSTIIRHGLRRVSQFTESRDEAAQEQIIDRLMSASDGSMLYAFLAVRYLELQKDRPSFDQAVDALIKSPHTTSEAVQKILGVAHLNKDSRALISLLVAAERPLSRKEVELLLQVQLQQGQTHQGHVDLDAVIRSVTPFAMTGEGLITLRHRAVKDALVSIPDASSLSLRLKDRHTDFLMRLFSCSRGSLSSRDECEPTLSFLDQEHVETRLATDRILEYTVRYWPVHFRKSPSLFKPEGDLQLPQSFSSIFPSSVGLVLLESGCWRMQSFNEQAMELFTLAYRVRRAAFGEHHRCTLQSAIICAMFCDNVLSRPTDAVAWYFKVCTIGREVLGVQSELVITCCTTIIRLSKEHVSKTRTDIMICREQTFLLLISAYKHRFGETSEEVLEIYNSLLELYTFVGEEHKAKEISVHIKGITERDHSHSRGENHHHSQGGSRNLQVTLKKNDRPVVDNYDHLLFGYNEEEKESSWTLTRVQEMISMTVKFMQDKQYDRAEEFLLELWLKLDEHCRGSQAREWHEKKIQVTLKYVEVLHLQNRKEEATALLLSCWNEYSNHATSTSESVIVLLKEVGTWLQRFQMPTVALTVFQKCWSWFKSSHKDQTSVFQQIEEQIAVTSKAIVKSSSSTSTMSVTEASESVMREVFESSFSSTEITETSEVSSATIELCESLSSVYMKEEKFSQAASVIEQTLTRSSFSSFFSDSLERIDIKSTTTSKNIALVTRLAQCYVLQKKISKAENLYLRLYRLHRNCCARPDDALVIQYTNLYVEFLKKHNMSNQLITFYQELLVEYRGFYGHAHANTISVLYELGDLCRKHSVTHGYFVDYYVEIVTNLNQGARICQEGAFRALLIVADHYYQSQRFSESLVYFRSIVATFCKFGTKYKHFEDATFVEQTLEKYYKAIEETKVEISEHLEILKEIRQACLQHFGAESSISVNVTLTLAEVCQRSEKYQYEAVSYYEHILKHSKTVSKTVVERSQSTLKSLYVKQVTSSTSSKTVSKETIDKATELSYMRYLEIRKSHPVTHHTTLTQLKELVTLYQKQSRTEAAVTEMRSLVVECLSKVTSAQELIDTAKYVAEIYTSCGYISHAQSLVRELKMQLIYKISSQGCAFDLTRVDIRTCFPFLAAFEWSIRSDMSLTITSFMAELLAESMFYERFSASIKAKSQMHVVLMHAARLRHMLFRMHRNKDFDIAETKAVDYFISVEPSIAKACPKNSVRAFLTVLLAHFSTRQEQMNQDAMTSRAGHAAVRELRSLLRQHKYKDAVELARCTYLFLMAHEGLDDPNEISLGFQLSLLMAGRNVDREDGQTNGHKQEDKHDRHLPGDPALQKEMMGLAGQILSAVLEICKTHNISLVRCQWSEINDLISLLGELKDLPRLQWLLNTLWESRDGQSKWGHDVMLALGTRLVQAHFLGAKNESDRKVAIRLAEDLAYNVRRVHGARHQRTLDIMSLLASLYTSTAQKYQGIGGADANGAGSDKKRAEDMARLYYKKAAVVHEDVLKLLIDSDSSDEGSDSESVTSGSTARRGDNYRGSRRPSSRGPGHMLSDNGHHHHHHHHHHHTHRASISREQEVQTIQMHLRLLKIALQRLGSWARPAGEIERLTGKLWQDYHSELGASGVKEDQILSKKWKVEGYGNGRSEGKMDEGAFAEPALWGVTV